MTNESLETKLEKQALDLLKLDAYNEKVYENISLTTLTAFVVYWLDEWSLPTSLENVSVASHRMFPTKFAMVGWPQFPDVNRTNRSVLQMRPKYRNLATSVSDKGVFLSEAGLREAEAVLKKFGVPHFQGLAVEQPPLTRVRRGSGKAWSIHPEDLINSVKQSTLFSLYTEGRFDESEAIHLIGMLRLYDHTPSSEKRKKLKVLIEQAKTAEDDQVVLFLKAVLEKFSRYLHR